MLKVKRQTRRRGRKGGSPFDVLKPVLQCHQDTCGQSWVQMTKSTDNHCSNNCRIWLVFFKLHSESIDLFIQISVKWNYPCVYVLPWPPPPAAITLYCHGYSLPWSPKACLCLRVDFAWMPLMYLWVPDAAFLSLSCLHFCSSRKEWAFLNHYWSAVFDSRKKPRIYFCDLSIFFFISK